MWTVVATAALLLTGCSTDRSDAIQDFSGSTRQQIVAERDNAAIVQVIAEYKATVSVPTLGYNDSALQALASQVASRAANGEIAGDTKTLLDTITRAIDDNPDGYFTADAPSQESSVTLDYQCSGAIVTPDGYIVTAAHCTNVAADRRQRDYIDAGFPKIRDAAVQQFQAQTFQGGSGGITFDSDQQKMLTDAVATFLTTHVRTSDASPTYSTLFASSASISTSQSLPVRLVTQGNAPPKSAGPFGDADISIVKIDNYADLPTLPVISDADVEVGQEVYIDGYPAAANARNSDNSSTLPTMTSSTINSKQRSDQGIPILGTSATTSFGNSGGPGLNSSGEMVGVVSYGSTEANFNFLIGGSVVLQFLREKNIQPRESTTTRLYNVALNDFHRHFYKRALQGFQQVKALDGGHPYVDSFIQRSTEAVSQGKDQTPPLEGASLVLVIAGAVAIVLVVAFVVALLLVTRARGRSTASPLVPLPDPSGQPPPAAPPAWTGPPSAPPGWRPPAAAPPSGAPSPPSQGMGTTAPHPRADVAWRWDGQQWVPVPLPGTGPASPEAPGDPPRSPGG